VTLPWRDSIATLLVALGVVLFAGWAAGATVPGFERVGAVAIAILVLGILASGSAVVPGFGELLRGSRPYLAATSVLGLVALVSGLYAVVTDESWALVALAAATLVLWAVSTWRHLATRGPQHRLGHP
jgi:hypothetical protein